LEAVGVLNPLLWALLGLGVAGIAYGTIAASQTTPSTTNPPVPAGTPPPVTPAAPVWTPPTQSITATTSTYPSTATLFGGQGAVLNLATVPSGGVAIAQIPGTFVSITPSPVGEGLTAPTVATAPNAITFGTQGGGNFSYTVTWTDSSDNTQTTTIVLYAVN
jgi:hypothetical protein